MKRHQSSFESLSSINLTPLLDVTFILLIAFMIIAPALKYGVELELPEVKAAPVEVSRTQTIAIKAPLKGEQSSRVYLAGKRVSLKDLEGELKELFAANPKLDVVIEADKRVPYGEFMSVLGTVKETGISNIGLLSQPPQKEK